MNTEDGFLRNLFQTIKPDLSKVDFEEETTWICDYINQSIDEANEFLKHKISKLQTRRDKLQFLYDCRACIKWELSSIETTFSQYCCPSHPAPKEILEHPTYVKEQASRLEKFQSEFVELTDKLERFDRTKKRIDCAIDYFEDCKKVDCFDNSKNESKAAHCFSNSQQVLIFYYFFKHSGLEPRKNIDIAPIAKFIHLITGKDFNSVNNSDFYKKLKTIPNFKSDKDLIKDLEIIKPLFAKVQLPEIVKMIENEIDLARVEIKHQKKEVI